MCRYYYFLLVNKKQDERDKKGLGFGHIIDERWRSDLSVLSEREELGSLSQQAVRGD